MTLTFTRDSDYAGARIVARSGRVSIGAIFPPWGRTGTKWRWRMWVEAAHAAYKAKARKEGGATAEINAAWAAARKATS